MKDTDFCTIFGYELSMTNIWQQFAANRKDGLQLFRMQADMCFEDLIANQMLGGRLHEQMISVGFHQESLAICFHAESFRRKYESFIPELSECQQDILQQMIQTWTSAERHHDDLLFYSSDHDLAWLPDPEKALSIGIIGLYDCYRTEEPDYIRYPEYIQLMNSAIDKYKYLACRQIVTEPENVYAHRIYDALGRIKYLPPRTLTDAFQMLLLHCQIFRQDQLHQIDRLLLPFDHPEMSADNAEESYLKGLMREFFSKYSFCITSIGHIPKVTMNVNSEMNVDSNRKILHLLQELMAEPGFLNTINNK